MKKRAWTLAAGLAAVAALVAVPAAMAAYTSAKLEVRTAGTSATIKATPVASHETMSGNGRQRGRSGRQAVDRP